jgi:two-component system chemotaxis response regulator CheY
MVRRHEAEHGLGGDNGVKIIMTTALSDPQNVMQAFKGQCDAYVVKPIEFQKLTAEMSKLGLID